MTVTVEPTPTVRAGAEGGWFIGGRMPNVKSIGWAISQPDLRFGFLAT